MKNSPKIVEQRIIGLELYIRKALHTLTLYASMDNSASKGLRHLQQFLGVDRKIDCIHPPPMDDQRAIEIMAYQFLNDYNSPACQQCVRFINSVDLENMSESGEDGFRSLLTFLHDALAEVEQFVQQQHEQQLVILLGNRRPDWTEEQHLKLVRLCIRRQVESTLYLPLRRTVFRIVQSYVAEKSKKLQRAIALLQQAKPSVFMVDYEILRTASLPKTVKAFRKAIMSYLPVDQGQFLVESAKLITELHGEIRELKQADLEESRPLPPLPPPFTSQKSSSSNSPAVSAKITDPLSSPTTTTSNGKYNHPPLPRIPSETGHSDKAPPPSRSSLTGLFGSQKVDRKPSLQERIKEFVEADKVKSSSTFDEDETGEVEDDNPLRVSFTVGPNLAIQYSSKRKLNEKKGSISGVEGGIKDLKISSDPLSLGISPIKEENETDPLNSSVDDVDRTSFSETPKKAVEVAQAVKSPESTSSASSPTNARRRSVSRPTSLLRKVSSQEMMSDPLLRPLAIEMAGNKIDKEYFEDVFDRYSQSFAYTPANAEEVSHSKSSIQQLFDRNLSFNRI